MKHASLTSIKKATENKAMKSIQYLIVTDAIHFI